MPNTYFQFKQFRIEQKKSGMKVTTDGCLFGALVTGEVTKMDVEPKCILDIGTGTGLLSLMLAQVTTESQIDSIDINERAFEEASNNLLISSVISEMVKGLPCIFEYVMTGMRKRDLISIANCPEFHSGIKTFL